MLELLGDFWQVTLSTVVDVIPIVAILFGFQLLVIRKSIPNLKKVLIGLLMCCWGCHCFCWAWSEPCSPLVN